MISICLQKLAAWFAAAITPPAKTSRWRTMVETMISFDGFRGR